MSRRNDLEDARYVVRFRYVDTDIAEKYFPERAAVLGRAAGYLGDRRFQYDEDDIYYMGEQINAARWQNGYRSSLNGMQTGWMERKRNQTLRSLVSRSADVRRHHAGAVERLRVDEHRWPADVLWSRKRLEGQAPDENARPRGDHDGLRPVDGPDSPYRL